MKLAIIPLVFAAAVLAQGDMSTPPAAESTPAPMETAAGSAPVPMETVAEGTPVPESPMPTSLPSTHIGGYDTMSLVSRLMSYFDFTHVDATVASTPVVMAGVYDPTTGKFTVLSANVVQSGDAYYVPVCSTDSIVPAGDVPVATQGAMCSYGIQLTPMPSNAASALYGMLRLKLRLIMSLAKPSFWGMRNMGNMRNMMAQMRPQM